MLFAVGGTEATLWMDEVRANALDRRYWLLGFTLLRANPSKGGDAEPRGYSGAGEPAAMPVEPPVEFGCGSIRIIAPAALLVTAAGA